MKQTFTNRVCWTVMIILGLCLAFIMSQAKADKCPDHNNHCNPTVNPTVENNTYIKRNNQTEDTLKGIAAGIVLTCLVRSVYVRSVDNKWTLCGDLPKDEPPPNPGPALKVTPDNLSDGVRLTQ